jgi:hypothetical protein
MQFRLIAEELGSVVFYVSGRKRGLAICGFYTHNSFMLFPWNASSLNK